MRVLLVGHHPDRPGGIPKAVRYTGRLLDQEHGHEIAYCSDGLASWKVPARYPYAIYPFQRSSFYEDNRGGWEQFRSALGEFQPDAVVMLGDIWEFPWLPELRAEFSSMKYTRTPKLILWLTVDCAPLPATYVANNKILTAPDHLAATTQFGVDLLAGRIGTSRAPARLTATHIPLGVDPEIYNPDGPPGREACRGIYPEDRLILGWVGTNTSRKRIATAIEMTAVLRERGHDPAMIMKTSMTGQRRLPDVLLHCGLQFKRGLPIDSHEGDVYILEERIAEPQMAELYRSLDVYAHTASAGAPELPLLEARACGTTTVAVDTASFPEVADHLADTVGGHWVIPDSYHEVASAETLADAVERALECGPVERPVTTWNDTARALNDLLLAPRPDHLEGLVI